MMGHSRASVYIPRVNGLASTKATQFSNSKWRASYEESKLVSKMISQRAFCQACLLPMTGQGLASTRRLGTEVRAQCTNIYETDSGFCLARWHTTLFNLSLQSGPTRAPLAVAKFTSSGRNECNSPSSYPAELLLNLSISSPTDSSVSIRRMN
jgi:hypothetical protein